MARDERQYPQHWASCTARDSDDRRTDGAVLVFWHRLRFSWQSARSTRACDADGERNKPACRDVRRPRNELDLELPTPGSPYRHPAPIVTPQYPLPSQTCGPDSQPNRPFLHRRCQGSSRRGAERENGESFEKRRLEYSSLRLDCVDESPDPAYLDALHPKDARERWVVAALVVPLAGVYACAWLLTCLFDNTHSSPLGHAELEMGKISGQAQLWVEEPTNHGCPTVQQLIEDKALPTQQNPKDPWGGAYVIVCPANGSEVFVLSAGHDKTWGTTDDVSSNRKPQRSIDPSPTQVR